MKKAKVYYVNGTAVAINGNHFFKDYIAGYGSDLIKLRKRADIIELQTKQDGFYYLNKEGIGEDFGEKYLIASHNITAGGSYGEDGSIGAIRSPIISYNDYNEGIAAIKELMQLPLEKRLSSALRRLLFIGVCGEMEGYLASTIIALVEGVREVFLNLRKHKHLNPCKCSEEQKWRENIVEKLNKMSFQHFEDDKSKERVIYQMLFVNEIPISSKLRDYIKWRNKLAHKVVYYEEPNYPTNQDIIDFIRETDSLINFIDSSISQYKALWLDSGEW